MRPSTAVLVTCVILYQSFCVSSNKISISNHCHGNQHCQSLESVSKQSINNTVLMIIDTQYTLLEVAKFVRAGNVTLIGKGKHNTQLICADNITGAGIIFENSSNVSLRDLTITECGLNITDSMANRNLTGTTTAVLINRCSQVTISSIIVSNSGQGLTLVNTLSQVNVTDSQFINNIVVNKEDWPGGGGLQILFNLDFQGDNGANYFISRNKIAYNKASSPEAEAFNSNYAGRGGGIRIFLFNGCKNIHIVLDENNIENNSAVFGGGLLVYLSGNASHNVINISNNVFLNNSAPKGGGGGAVIGYSIYQKGIYLHEHLYPTHNHLTVFNSTFKNNTAAYGGGMSTFTSSIGFFYRHPYNKLICNECLFENNVANDGAALDVSVYSFGLTGAQYIATPLILDCTFVRNRISTDPKSNGAVHVVSVPLRFNGTTTFIGNTGSALYIASASVTFSEYSHVVYESNSGYKGGAIHMFGDSQINVFDNSSFYFQDNKATLYGGAICVETSQPHFLSFVDLCFLRVSLFDSNNITFNFSGNSARIGNDIFTTTIAPCAALCQYRSNDYTMSDLSTFFQESCLGTFNFSGNKTISTHVTTSPRNLTIEGNSSLVCAVPGNITALNTTQRDELGENVSQFFPLSAKIAGLEGDKCAKIHPDYLVVTDNNLIIIGNPGAQGKLLLQSQSVKKMLDFQLNDCPPGFILDDLGCDAQCTCFEILFNISLSYNNLQCIPGGSVAIRVGYWAGYANTSNTSQDTLYTGNCIVELLTHNIEDDNVLKEIHKLFKLPRHPSELETKICDKNREGLLCGRCNENTSVYYHSNRYTCGTNEYCRYGILIYIVSELLPVTILFTVILLLNISLTSGALYGFVFYAQTLSLLGLTAFGSIHISNKITRSIVTIYHTLLGLFNVSIAEGVWQYCIVETKTIMTLFMFRYATMAYAFFLVAATIIILRLYSFYHCIKFYRKCGRKNIRGSIVDGLATFLVLCYFQCASNTARILSYSQISGIGGANIKTVALYDGEMEHLGSEHWFYASAAFICLLIVLIPPPTILLMEPLLTKVFSMNCFTNTFVRMVYCRLRLKLMPFLDSFQACFKDKHRYFAGLYFLYRILIPLFSTFSRSISFYYSLIAFIIFVILFIHTSVQPYKKKWHNLVEQSLFFNLILTLALTYYNYKYNTNDGTNAVYVQLILLSLPIAYIIGYTAVVAYRRYFPNRLHNNFSRMLSKNQETTSTVDDELPARLLTADNDTSLSINYNTY